MPTGLRSYLEDLVVDEPYRQHGAATSLLQAALDFAWPELAPLIDEPDVTRRRLRRELWVALFNAGAGHGSLYRS